MKKIHNTENRYCESDGQNDRTEAGTGTGLAESGEYREFQAVRIFYGPGADFKLYGNSPAALCFPDSDYQTDSESRAGIECGAFRPHEKTRVSDRGGEDFLRGSAENSGAGPFCPKASGIFSEREEGILKIGFLKDSDFEMMRNLVTGFHERYPDIRLELGGHIRKDLEDLLDSGELDVILNIDASDTPDFRKVFLEKFPLVAVVHRDHPLALEERICADDLKNLIYDIRQEKDGRPNFEMEGALLQVSCNLGEAIVNEFVIQQNIRPYVAVIPLKPDRGRDMYMMCHRNKYNPLISCFEDFLKTTFR